MLYKGFGLTIFKIDLIIPIKMDLNQRIETVKQTDGSTTIALERALLKIDPLAKVSFEAYNQSRLNCRGTALYVAGVVPNEEYLTPEDVEGYLDLMERVHTPEVGDLVVFREPFSGNHHHVAVVIGTNPTKIFQRRTSDCGIITEDDLEEFHNIEYPFHGIEYYRPNSL